MNVILAYCAEQDGANSRSGGMSHACTALHTREGEQRPLDVSCLLSFPPFFPSSRVLRSRSRKAPQSYLQFRETFGQTPNLILGNVLGQHTGAAVSVWVRFWVAANTRATYSGDDAQLRVCDRRNCSSPFTAKLFIKNCDLPEERTLGKETKPLVVLGHLKFACHDDVCPHSTCRQSLVVSSSRIRTSQTMQ